MRSIPRQREWFGVDRGDVGEVIDANGVSQNFVICVNVRDGYAVRFKSENGRLVLNDAGDGLVREEVTFAAPVRFIPRGTS